VNKHEEARGVFKVSMEMLIKAYAKNSQLPTFINLKTNEKIDINEINTKINDYITDCEATEKELELYRKLVDLMICVPQNETYHYVVRYTDDVKFNSILNQINKLSKVGEQR